MNKFESYVKRFDISSRVTDEEIQNTKELLELYSPALRRSARSLDEMEEFCQESRRQSISDFINLAIDYDRDSDRKRIAARLYDVNHSMELLRILEDALLLVRDTTNAGSRYYDILRMRYFDAFTRSNEDAYLALNMSSATFYRNIKPAIRLFAACLWHVVIPDLIIKAQANNETSDFEPRESNESQMRVF